jgi:hypothetical protein
MQLINNYPLFLPNVTKTYTNSSNALLNEDLRLQEARKALFYIIEKKYFNKIVLVDGSNTKILSEKEISFYDKNGIIIEQLLFQQKISDVRKYGKSQGEMQITNFMISNSVLVKNAGGFTKISPRYIFDNIDEVMPIINNKKNIFYYYHPPFVREIFSFVCTIFYKTSIEFYKEHLENSIEECNNDVSGFLESVFFRKLQNINKTAICSEFPHWSGLAGTTGKSIYNNHFKIRNSLCQIGLLAYEFKD